MKVLRGITGKPRKAHIGDDMTYVCNIQPISKWTIKKANNGRRVSIRHMKLNIIVRISWDRSHKERRITDSRRAVEMV
jgi:hypothetical protein